MLDARRIKALTLGRQELTTDVVMRFAAAKLVAALTLILFAAPLAAEAQQAGKVPRVGVLSAPPLSSMMFPRQFPEALRDLGYIEKQNIVLEWRSADGRPDRLADLAAELARAKVDVIVAITNPDVLAAKRATTTIPIIMAAAADPVGAGFVASLARPGGNITGRSYSSSETVAKQLEVFKETVPAITRVVYLRGEVLLPTTQEGLSVGARALGLTLREVQLPTDDVARALEEVRRWRPDGLYVSPGIPAGHLDAILKFAAQHLLPAMSGIRGIVEAGGLMAYAPSALEAARRTAYYVDRILKGARPADLPVEQPQRYDLVINLKTAKQIGLTIPQSILLRADALIE
jgi:putative ABC transport system substrate-binding protein